MIERVAIDTNVFLYQAGVNDEARRKRAAEVIVSLGQKRAVIPTQVLGEFFHALVVRHRRPRDFAEMACRLMEAGADLQPASAQTFRAAFALAAAHHMQFWDALILSTAADAGCSMLLSEDMHHGFVHRGVTVINPFLDPLHPLLADALSRPPA